MQWRNIAGELMDSSNNNVVVLKVCCSTVDEKNAENETRLHCSFLSDAFSRQASQSFAFSDVRFTFGRGWSGYWSDSGFHPLVGNISV